VVGLTKNDKKRKADSLTRTCGLEFIPFYKPLLAHNGRRYGLVAGNGFQTVMARVFAKTF
jgi:hypothetical protein